MKKISLFLFGIFLLVNGLMGYGEMVVGDEYCSDVAFKCCDKTNKSRCLENDIFCKTDELTCLKTIEGLLDSAIALSYTDCSSSPKCVKKTTNPGGASCTVSGGKSGTCKVSSACTGEVYMGADTSGRCIGLEFCCVPKTATEPNCTAPCKSTSDCTLSKGTPETSCKSTCSGSMIHCKAGSGTTPEPTPPTDIAFDNPLGSITTVEAVIEKVLNGLQGVIVTLSLVFIIIGAVIYVTSAGNDKQIELAKGAIFAAMIGLAIGIAAPSFLKEIAKILGWGGTTPSGLSISAILFNVLNFLLGILGVLAMIMLVIGGIMYLTSGGNDNQTERGKKILIWAIVGLLVAFTSLIIVRQIANFF